MQRKNYKNIIHIKNIINPEKYKYQFLKYNLSAIKTPSLKYCKNVRVWFKFTNGL